jgi:exo-rhamnogalacturonan lyase-like protein
LVPSRIVHRCSCILGIAIWALIFGVPARAPAPAVAAEAIPLTVREYAGSARVSEPVTTGIPIAPGQVGSSWALFDGAVEVPLQTAVLPHRSTPWLLLDFQSSLSANEEKSFTLREQAPTASTTKPIVITETSSRITVTTGLFRTDLGKSVFNLLDNVWLDANANGTFSSTEKIITAASTSNLTARSAGTASDVPGRGLPSKLEWEYRGPMRATLRVDGAYANGTDTLLHWTTRLTWYAGQTCVRVDHAIRNSNRTRERYVKLSSARLKIGSSATAGRIERAGATVWADATPGAALELIPATAVVSTAYDMAAIPPVPRVNTTIDVDANGGLLLGDLSHHGATWILEFSDPSASERTRRAAVATDPLVALAAPERYSELGAFGLQRASTYEDEKSAYRRWGWTWPTSGNPWSQEHNLPRVQDLRASWSEIDATRDPESDDLWQNVALFARIRLPYYLDRLRAWARYARTEWAFRTDGFDYAGAWGQYGDGPGTVSREPVLAPTLTVLDNAYLRNNIKNGKPGSSHIWNGGLLDVYYLTGDREALEAAIDVAEECERFLAWRTPETDGVGGNARFQARCLLVLVRTWEATSQTRWKTAADHAVQLFVRSPHYDARGFFYGEVRDAAPNVANRFTAEAKLVAPFMMTAVVEALYRYYLATLDPAVKEQLLQIAAFAMQYGLDPATDYAGDEMVVDSPQPGDVLHLTESQWRDAPPIIPYVAATSSQCFINALVIRYRLTGEGSYLARAQHCWDRASKRNHVAPYDQPCATATQVGRFVNSLQGTTSNTRWFPESGNWTATSLLFYDAARADSIAPGRVGDLVGRKAAPRPISSPGTQR